MARLRAPIDAGLKIVRDDRTGDYSIDATEFIENLKRILEELFQEASSGWTVTNKTEDRTLDCDCDDTAVLGDVLGTLIDDLISKGIIESCTRTLRYPKPRT